MVAAEVSGKLLYDYIKHQILLHRQNKIGSKVSHVRHSNVVHTFELNLLQDQFSV